MMNPRKSEANKPPKLPETTKAHKPRSQLLGPKSCKEQKGKSKKPRSEKAKRHKGHTKATQKLQENMSHKSQEATGHEVAYTSRCDGIAGCQLRSFH